MEKYWGIIDDFKNNNSKVICQKCRWSWKVKDGGDDLYVCHNCNYDNSNFYLSHSNFENDEQNKQNVIGSIAGAVGSIAGAVGSISQSKSAKELSKSDTQKEIDARCGKDRSRSWKKKSKKNYKECKQKVIEKIDSDFNKALKIKSEEKQDKIKQENKNKELFLSNSKKEKKQSYIIIGVLALILGILYINKIQVVNKPI